MNKSIWIDFQCKRIIVLFSILRLAQRSYQEQFYEKAGCQDPDGNSSDGHWPGDSEKAWRTHGFARLHHPNRPGQLPRQERRVIPIKIQEVFFKIIKIILVFKWRSKFQFSIYQLQLAWQLFLCIGSILHVFIILKMILEMMPHGLWGLCNCKYKSSSEPKTLHNFRKMLPLMGRWSFWVVILKLWYCLIPRSVQRLFVGLKTEKFKSKVGFYTFLKVD